MACKVPGDCPDPRTDHSHRRAVACDQRLLPARHHLARGNEHKADALTDTPADSVAIARRILEHVPTVYVDRGRACGPSLFRGAYPRSMARRPVALVESLVQILA